MGVHPFIIAAIIGFLVVYFGSCVFHPYTPCKTCKRSREVRSSIFKGAFGKCRTCNGVGHHIRLGARMMGHKG